MDDKKHLQMNVYSLSDLDIGVKNQITRLYLRTNKDIKGLKDILSREGSLVCNDDNFVIVDVNGKALLHHVTSDSFVEEAMKHVNTIIVTEDELGLWEEHGYSIDAVKFRLLNEDAIDLRIPLRLKSGDSISHNHRLIKQHKKNFKPEAPKDIKGIHKYLPQGMNKQLIYDTANRIQRMMPANGIPDIDAMIKQLRK